MKKQRVVRGIPVEEGYCDQADAQEPAERPVDAFRGVDRIVATAFIRPVPTGLMVRPFSFGLPTPRDSTAPVVLPDFAGNPPPSGHDSHAGIWAQP